MEKIRDATSTYSIRDTLGVHGQESHYRPDQGFGGRVSAKRERTPDILEVEEMRLLLGALGLRERAMVFLDMALGLRRGELAGLKREDVNFEKLYLNVTRSVVDQQIGNTKTEVSRNPSPSTTTSLKICCRREQTPYRNPSDWVFATDSLRAGANRGKQPLWLSTIMSYYIQPKTLELGITKRVPGTHSVTLFYSAEGQR